MAQMLTTDDTLMRQVRAMTRQGTLPHAVILSGAGDRLAAARYLASAMVCAAPSGRPCLQCTPCRKVARDIHPDVHIVQDTQRRELSVDDVRQVRQDVYILPNDGEQKVYIFADCSQLNERDQNVLLKIVEEGPAYAGFIFCTESASALLPTICSRCVELKLRQEEDTQESETAAAFCKALSSGELLAVTSFLVSLENRKYKREQVQQLLQEVWHVAAQALTAQSGYGSPSESAELLRRNLSRRQLQRLTDVLKKYSMECYYNVGAGHVLGAICAEWEEIL